jgi:metacaspase-1
MGDVLLHVIAEINKISKVLKILPQIIQTTEEEKMPRGVTINIGINSLDTDHYGDDYDILTSAEKDARNMNALAKKQGFGLQSSDSVLLVEFPTAEMVLKHIRNFALKSADENPNTDPNIKPLQSGDILLLTYAGHGSLVPDVNSNNIPSGEERSLYDQTWCLHDRQIIDDELAQVASLFCEGVRILFISDSCHSGTVLTVFAPEHSVFALTSNTKIFSLSQVLTEKFDSIAVKIKDFFNLKKERFRLLVDGRLVFGTNEDEKYTKAIKSLEDALKLKNEKENTNAKSFKDFIKASVISISACQDDEKAKDGDKNGVFTAAIKYICYGTDTPKPADKVKFSGNYQEFFTDVQKNTHARYSLQTPNLTTIPENVNREDWNLFLDKNGNEHLKAFMHKKPFEL